MQKYISVRAGLAIPLMREGVPIGVLGLTRLEPRPFTDKQIDLITTFADQAVIAIENVRLFDEVKARTRELSELLEQQTATSEVLKVISSSPGELEPVFNAMLENATRICEAKFGVLFQSEGDALRTVAMHDAPQPYVEERRRNPTIKPAPATALGRALATKQPVQIADVLNEPQYFDVPSGYASPLLNKLAGARTVLAVPMLKENELIGCNCYLPPGSTPVHRQANRAGQEFRRPSRHRHREHPTAQRAAPAHRRSFRIVGAADGDIGGAEGHLKFTRRA